MSTKIGKAKYGGEFVQRKYFKLKDGESTFRILPPLGDLAESGKWSMFYRVHYGYRSTDNKLKPFVSPEVKNRKTGMVEVPDAAIERIENLKAAYAAAREANDTKRMESLKELLENYNLDKNHYMNVIDEQGNIGVLKIRHRAKLALDAAIKRLRDQDIDPLSVDNGRYFIFRRSGTGPETIFQVDVKSERKKVEGLGMVNVEIVHTLTDDLIERLGKEAAELDKLFKHLSSEEVAAIVKASDLKTGISPVIDELFNVKKNATNSTESEDDSDYEEESSEETEISASKSDSSASTSSSKTAEPAKASTPKAKSLSTPPPSAKTTAQQVSEMSDEDFLKSLGL
jgi:hypothetical protein